MQTGNRKL